MAHCTADTDESTDCGVDSTGKYYVYSWDKSLIRTYLNGEFLTNLESKINNEIVSTPICSDPSKNTTGGLDQSYGGYLMSELNEIGKNCDTDSVNDKVRLISEIEYNKIYNKIQDNMLDSSWLYCNSIACGNSKEIWSTMCSFYFDDAIGVQHTRYVYSNGILSNSYSNDVNGVRPVITIVK